MPLTTIMKPVMGCRSHWCFSAESRWYILKQRWGTYLISRAAWIVGYCCKNLLILSENSAFILPRENKNGKLCQERERRLLTYCLPVCLSCDFVWMWYCILTWVMKILVRAILNVHTGRRFPIPVPQCSPKATLSIVLHHHCLVQWHAYIGGGTGRLHGPRHPLFNFEFCLNKF